MSDEFRRKIKRLDAIAKLMKELGQQQIDLATEAQSLRSELLSMQLDGDSETKP